MFARSIQPGLVSLFSSTGGGPLELFSVEVDDGLPSDSFVHLLNDITSHPAPPAPASLISLPNIYRDENAATGTGRELDQTVLHIQSPTLRTTFIQCPPSPYPPSGGMDLGLRHTWLHIQVRNLGREWTFEACIVDKVGRCGIVRCSTFQEAPRVIRNADAAPVLHLPLRFQPSSSSSLTAWSTVTLHLPSFIPQFASVARSQMSSAVADNGSPVDRSSLHQTPLPGGSYSHLAFIKIYATCRLRRVWLSDHAPVTGTPWEFQLYGN
ncbi:hypothetical protein F5I97DRAFT_1090446 [Phlebopus sp. FC_14]|nr:hypothetical protein F5I97DRAFT_1090446 [Phlebopus sp. FC_14]